MIQKKMNRCLTILMVLSLIVFSTACGSSKSSTSLEDNANESINMTEESDPIQETPLETDNESDTPLESNTEPELLPELEAKITVTNLVSECLPEVDYCGFDIRLGGPPSDSSEVSVVILDIKQDDNTGVPVDGCSWANEAVGDTIATFNSGGIPDWDVGRGFGLTLSTTSNLSETKTCEYTFGATGADNYSSLESFSYTFTLKIATVSDITAPEPPINVECLPSGGSGEFLLQWESPQEPDDVFGIYAYVSENNGPYNRVLETLISDGAVNTGIDGGTKWGVVIYPLPGDTPLMLAVTTFDENYNESGWWPIDAYFGSGLDCFTGPPPTPNIGIISPAGGSMETSIQILPNGTDPSTAEDIASYAIQVDTGSGFEEIAISNLQVNTVTGGVDLILYPIDHAPTDYRITAIDYHGNSSGMATRSCPDPGVMECN